ncbi:MAG TPA: hypothetical protein VFK05_06920 [Polyangiaceae bacterium]|nr:hypothetical protein [Polyangiaceae bacterium]
MNSRLRGLLVLAPVVALGAAVLVSTGSDHKRAKTVPEKKPSASDDEREAPPPSKTAAPAVEATIRSPKPQASVAAAGPSADSLAAAMHALEDSAPERALELARRGQALWPAGPRAPEFAATEVKCLYRLGRPSDGRGAAEAMVNKYPTSTWALEVERQTGAHPYVNH